MSHQKQFRFHHSMSSGLSKRQLRLEPASLAHRSTCNPDLNNVISSFLRTSQPKLEPNRFWIDQELGVFSGQPVSFFPETGFGCWRN